MIAYMDTATKKSAIRIVGVLVIIIAIFFIARVARAPEPSRAHAWPP